jgi:hypothetical protein
LIRNLFPFLSETIYRREFIGKELIILVIFSLIKFFDGFNLVFSCSVNLGMDEIRCERINGGTNIKIKYPRNKIYIYIYF